MRGLAVALLIMTMGLGMTGGAQAQARVVAQAEREVTYSGAGGTTLAGTLLLPRHQVGQRLPGAIIVVGSGAVDRNGNAGTALISNLYQQLADQLALAGIASLRYDKRGVGASEPPPIDDSEPMTNQTALIAFNDWDNYVGDAAATLGYLQQQPEIDPARTAMLGHSEGGYFVLAAAVAGKGFADPPAALVLIASPGRPYDALITDQLAAQLVAQGADPTQAASVMQENQQIVDAIKANGAVPDNVPAAFSNIYPPYMGKFYQGGFAANPRQLAAQYPGAVLVLQGAMDGEVSPTLDAPALDAALALRPHDDHETDIIANASHSLKAVTSPDDPGYAGELVPDAANKLRTWLASKLTSGVTLAATPDVTSATATPLPATPTANPTVAPSPLPSPAPTLLAPAPVASSPAADLSGLLIFVLLLALLVVVGLAWWGLRRKR